MPSFVSIQKNCAATRKPPVEEIRKQMILISASQGFALPGAPLLPPTAYRLPPLKPLPW
ncbi:hypothetical protein AOG2_25520 [Geobacter sp. AOG2]|nr:hypothetical protein AOG2_25520 [Geobacter sp. AOG2]